MKACFLGLVVWSLAWGQPGLKLASQAEARATPAMKLASQAEARATQAEAYATPAMKTFEMVWRAEAGVLADASFLLDAPAGKAGFIQVRDGRLVKPDGGRFRIWGMNFTAAATTPSKEDAPRVAAHLARFGINCVRFHFLDSRAPRGIIDAKSPDSRHFDAERLDRLDYFVAELKKRGIYSNLNLNVGRMYTSADGVKDYAELGFAKALTLFDERLIELQKEYARMLLTHLNPYTKTEYRNEPAVATVELVNENSTVEAWTRGRLLGKGRGKTQDNTWLDIPASYERDLTAKYNAWLAKRLSAADLENLRADAGVAAGEAVPRLKPQEFKAASALRFRTEAAFYMDIEDRYFQQMYAYLKQELGVKAPVAGTSVHSAGLSGTPLLSSISKLDIVDGHTYWQHPRYLTDPATGRRTGYEIANTAMVNAPERSSIIALARAAVAGKPYTVSEINHPYPSEYAAEGVPIAAAYGALQDWDGIYWYTFEHSDPSAWAPRPPGHFDFRQDPVKMSQLTAGALMFLRGDVARAKRTVSRTYTREEVLESLRLPSGEAPFFTPGFPVALPLRHGVRIGSLDGPPTAAITAPAGEIVSDTGELEWKKGLVTVNTPRSQALIDYLKGHRSPLRHLAADVANDFCAITLGALDGESIARSPRLLLTAGARVANAGMKWNEKRTSTIEAGTAPVVIEPVTGSITLRGLTQTVRVEAVPLDGAGRAGGPVVEGRRFADGWRIPIGETPTPWYLIRARKEPVEQLVR